MADALRPGIHPRTLRGACAAAFAIFGVTTPAFEGVACALGGSASTWLPPDRVFVEDDRVVLRAGALRDGWEASFARTYRVGHRASAALEPPPGWHALVGACTAGTTAGALRTRGALVHGVGRGVEPCDDDTVLTPGMTIALELGGRDRVHQDIVEIAGSGTAHALRVEPPG